MYIPIISANPSCFTIVAFTHEELNLKLSLQRSAQFEIIAVGSGGRTKTRRIEGPDKPLAKAEPLTLSIDLPAQADYLLFRSRLATPQSEVSHELDQEVLQKLANRVGGQQELFSTPA